RSGHQYAPRVCLLGKRWTTHLASTGNVQSFGVFQRPAFGPATRLQSKRIRRPAGPGRLLYTCHPRPVNGYVRGEEVSPPTPGRIESPPPGDDVEEKATRRATRLRSPVGWKATQDSI